MDLVKVQALFIPLLYFLLGIGVLVIIWFGGKGIIAGRMTLGSFAAFVAYLMMLAWPMMAVGWVVNILERAEASMERIHKIMSAPIDIADIEGAVELKDVIARVQIQNLNFNYGSFKETKTGGDGWTLSDINLEINPGTTVGIVGSVGSGKSTLVKLLPRLYDPPKGTIFINGSAVEAINLDSLRNMIAFVPQDTFLFSESISENIDFQGVIAKDLFLEVCRQAGLAKDLELFPQGYDTIVGERGVTLSGGQKQRVSLARALLKSAPILIIDDALTAVDAETEAEILSNLRSVFKGKTVIMVTHRISTVKDFDLIIVLKEGRIVEKGDHNYLVLKEGEYYRLYRRQLLEQELNMI
jgi:ATP-binding cassette subfamily B protein